MTINTVQLSNTFNEFRTTTNQVIVKVNNLENGLGTIYGDAISANTVDGRVSVRANNVTTFGAYNLTLNTNSGTNSGNIVIGQGVNANVTIEPNGTGYVLLNTDNIRIGDQNVNANLTTWGTGDLILSTNLGLNSGTIRIYDGVNANVEISPNGTGHLNVLSDTLQIGDGNADASLTTLGTGDLILSTNDGTNSGTIRIYDGVNANVELAPNGTGSVLLNSDVIRIGDQNVNANLTTWGTGDLILNTNNGTNSGTIRIANGVNGNISLTPNGTGTISVPRLSSSGQITSTLAVGTAPFSITSTTVVPNLNVDKVDGKDIGAIVGSGAIIYADTSSSIASGTVGSAGQALISGGTSAPTWQTVASANGGTTIVARDANGSFSGNVITGVLFSGSGASLTSLNGSNISSGTVANARTTASSANGANLIVARDANGDFAGRIITASTLIAAVSGDGAGLSNLNAANIATGTISNARTTANSANGASTIVARDANGDFASRNITAVTFLGPVVGDGAGISNINGSNVATGTIANARTTASSSNGASLIVTRDANGDFTARNVTTTNISGTHSGDGAALTNLNASNIASGTIANARTSAASANGASTIVARDVNGDFAGRTITATTFSGSGASLTSLNASNISSGTIDNARTSAASANGASTIVARDVNGDFVARVVVASLTGNATTATTLQTARNINGVSFNGSADITVTANTTQTLTRGTYLTGSNFNGGTATTWAVDATDASTASKVVARDANASFSANVVTATSFSGSGASLTSLNGSNISSGTVANARTTAASANGASTIVARDANGSFAANAVTATTVSATSVSGTLSGNGASVTDINAGNISTGTLANARTTANSANGASTIVARDVNGSFTANVITALTFSGPFVGDGSSVTNINAGNISTGTLANARTTANSANGASTIVARDADGSFAANVVTATTVSATNLSGSGASITAINAGNISTGTLANARTTANSANGASTIVARDVNGDFAGRTITATTFSGSGASLTNIPNSATTASSANGASSIVARDANGSFAANVVTATTFVGSGALLTNVPVSATNASSANGASTIVARDANGSFSTNVITANAVTITNSTASTSTSTGALIVTGGVGIGGALNAISKSFIIKHPTKEGMLLRYGSLEGPELGVYVRGRNKTGYIILPDYWSGLVDPDTITVNITPIGRHQNIYVSSIQPDAVFLGNESDGPIDCFYTIYAERKDVEKLVVEFEG